MEENDQHPEDPVKKKHSRRDFLKKAAIIGAGSVVFPYCNLDEKPKQPHALQNLNETVRKHNANDAERLQFGEIHTRPLGNTGLIASDIAFGCLRLGLSESIYKASEKIRLAVDIGVNYFDVAPDYSYGNAERTLGEALSGIRDKVVITTKWCREGVGQNHFPPKTSVNDLIKGVEASLKRLKTDYIDFLLIHAVGESDWHGGGYWNDTHQNFHYNRINDPYVHEAFAKLKEAGKVRHLGASCHGVSWNGPNLNQILKDILDSNFFRLILCAYYPGMHGELSGLFEKAHENGIALVAMKSKFGSTLEKDQHKFSEAGLTRDQLIYKWILTNPNVSTVVRTVDTSEQLKEWTKMSGTKLSYLEKELVDTHIASLEGKCRVGCNECVSSCPYNLAIPAILRYDHYARHDHREREGIALYSQLPANMKIDSCQGCPAPCLNACPYKVDIPEALKDARNMLHIA